MAITTLEQYLASHKQTVNYSWAGDSNFSSTGVGRNYIWINITSNRFAPFTLGNTSPGNTTTGVVPKAGDAGWPRITAPQAGNKTYLSKVHFSSRGMNVRESLILIDVLFWAGALATPTSSTAEMVLSNQPDFSHRLPRLSDGVTPDYSVVQWLAHQTGQNNNDGPYGYITYTDQTDTAGIVSPNTEPFAYNAEGLRYWIGSLTGKSKIKKVEKYTVVSGVVGSSSTCVLVYRPLFVLNIKSGAKDVQVFGPDQTGMPEIHHEAALACISLQSFAGYYYQPVDFSMLLEIAEG